MRRIIFFPLMATIILIFGFFYGSSSVLSTEPERITPENIDRLTEIASIGRGTVEQITWTPDGQYVLVGTHEGFYLYDSIDVQIEPRFVETGHYLYYEISQDGAYVLGTPDGPTPKGMRLYFQVWEFASGRSVLSSENQFNNDQLLRILHRPSFLPDGSGLMFPVSSPLKAYQIKHDNPNTIERVENTPTGARYVSAVGEDGRYGASCKRQGNVDIWNIQTDTLINAFRIVDADEIPYSSTCAAFSPDGTLLTAFYQYSDRPNSDTEYGVALLWSMVEDKPVVKRRLPHDSVIGFDQNSIPIAITSVRSDTNQYPYVVSLIELDTNTVRWEVESSTGFDGGEFVYEKGLFVGERDWADHSELSSWDLANGNVLWSQSLPHSSFWEISPDQTRVVLGQSYGTDIQGWRYRDIFISLVDLVSGRLLSSTDAHMNQVYDPIFSPTSRYIIIGDVSRGFRIWDTVTWDVDQDFERVDFPMPRLTFHDPAFFDQNTLNGVISSSNGMDLSVRWDIETREVIEYQTTTPHFPLITLFNPKGDLAAEIDRESFETDNYNVTIVDRSANRVVLTFTVPFYLSKVVFSEDDTMIAIPSYEQPIQVWNVATGEQIYEFEAQHGEDYSLRDVAFSPDNQWLIAVYTSYDLKRTELWNLETGDYWGHVEAIEFSPDGSMFAAIDPDDFAVHFYDAESGEILADFPAIPNATDLAFSPDNRLMAIQTRVEMDYYGDPVEGEIWIYELAGGERLVQLNNHHILTNPQFSPDGTMLMTQASGRRVIVYGIK